MFHGDVEGVVALPFVPSDVHVDDVRDGDGEQEIVDPCTVVVEGTSFGHDGTLEDYSVPSTEELQSTARKDALF